MLDVVDEYEITIGELRGLSERLGPAELARQLDVKRSTLNNWILRGSEPSARDWIRIQAFIRGERLKRRRSD